MSGQEEEVACEALDVRLNGMGVFLRKVKDATKD